MSKKIFLFVYISLFVSFLIASYFYNSTLYPANDELKFGLIASGDIQYTEMHLQRTVLDFFLYYKSGDLYHHFFGSEALIFYKATSFFAGIFSY
ncbi:hypothetical protein N8878_05170, partial [Psychromonas sp.]|nr:hypothetical protein [Psychromonas sp.]